MLYHLFRADNSANITVIVPGGNPLVADDTHPKWDEIVQAVVVESSDDVDRISALFAPEAEVAARFENLSERVAVRNGRVYFDGDEVHGVITNHIMRCVESEVEDYSPLVNFLENVMQNPSEHSRENLYRWLDTNEFTITCDGMIVGYKGVRRNDEGEGYLSIHSGPAIVDGEEHTGGPVPQELGSVVEMSRSTVTHDPGVGCSYGLHVGTHSYASSFGKVCLEVEVNPRDVVSVPTDCADRKMRVCRYYVVNEVEEAYADPIKASPTTVPDDEDEPEYDDWYDDGGWYNDEF